MYVNSYYNAKMFKVQFSLLHGIFPPSKWCNFCAYHCFITLKIVQNFRVLFSQASETLKLAAPVGQSPASLPSNKKNKMYTKN